MWPGSVPMRDMRGYFKQDQVDAMLEAAKEVPQDYLFLLLLDQTGGRISEVLSLRPMDVDWDRGAILLPIKKRTRKSKSGKPRPELHHFLDLPKVTMGMLAMYMTKAPLEPKDRFFQFNRVTGWRRVRKYAFKAGIKLVGAKSPHPHNFRHTHAIDLARARVPLSIVKDRLGHADIRTTAFYLQFADEETKREINGFWAKDKAKKPPSPRTRKTPEESVAKVLGSLAP